MQYMANASSRNDEYVAVKAYARTSMPHVLREKIAYDRLAKHTETQTGRHHLRQVLDSFRLPSSGADSHLCLVHEPLHASLFTFQRFGGVAKPLSEAIAKAATRYILEALDYLHENTEITHCGKSIPQTSHRDLADTILNS